MTHETPSSVSNPVESAEPGSKPTGRYASGPEVVAIRELVFTDDVAGWARLVTVLGAEKVVDSPDYQEFSLPRGGLLGLHKASDGEPVGSCVLQILVANLDHAVSALNGLGVAGTPVDEDFGCTLTVDEAPAGPVVTLVEASADTQNSQNSESTSAPGDLMATPLSLVRDVTTTAKIFEALGLREVLRSDVGSFIQMVSPSGEVLVHHGDGGAQLSFEVEDTAEIERRCSEAGIEVAIVDEAYGKTALVETPDGPRMWINERQRDFYGYTQKAVTA